MAHSLLITSLFGSRNLPLASINRHDSFDQIANARKSTATDFLRAISANQRST